MTADLGRRRLIAAALGAGIGRAAWAPSPAHAQASQQTLPPSGYTPISEAGAWGDGIRDDLPAIARFLNDNPRSRVFFPPSDYMLAGTLDLRGFSGKLSFAAGARLVFGDSSRCGVLLRGGHGAVLSGYRSVFWPAPQRRINRAPALWLSACADASVDNARIENSAGAGIICDECVRPSVSRALVTDTWADGIHFANCDEPRVTHSRTERTGDDGVAFVSYRSKPGHRGGYAQFIAVRDSGARGIAVVGQSDVSILDFEVDTTSVSGLYCARETYYDTRIPDNVTFSRGSVRAAGTLAPPSGNRFGIEVFHAAAVAISNVVVTRSFDRGISVLSPAGSIDLSAVTIERPRRGSGAEIVARRVSINRLNAEECQGYGLFVADSHDVQVRNVRAHNVAKSDKLHRAVWFEHNQTLDVDGVTITDGASQATGYILGFAGRQQGIVRNISHAIASRALVIENRSSGVRLP